MMNQKDEAHHLSYPIPTYTTLTSFHKASFSFYTLLENILNEDF